MYFEYPDVNEAYLFDKQVLLETLVYILSLSLIQYYFGPDILVSPVTAPVDTNTEMVTKQIWIPSVRFTKLLIDHII